MIKIDFYVIINHPMDVSPMAGPMAPALGAGIAAGLAGGPGALPVDVPGHLEGALHSHGIPPGLAGIMGISGTKNISFNILYKK